MIAAPFLSRSEWEKRIRSWGCYPLEGKGPLNTAEWWRWPWPNSTPFTVPVEEDGSLEFWAFQRIKTDMARLAPNSWDWPDTII